MFIGVFLLLLGVLLLLDRMGIIYGDLGDWIPSVALIALGLHLISRNRRTPR